MALSWTKNEVTSIKDAFAKFANKGNVIDLAVAVIIGGAFQAIVNSLVKDIIMPPIGLLVKKNFENWFYVIRDGKTPGAIYSTIAQAAADGAVTLNFGNFLQAVINFFLIAWILFCVVTLILYANTPLPAPPAPAAAPTTEPCPHCTETISVKATRCKFCCGKISRV